MSSESFKITDIFVMLVVSYSHDILVVDFLLIFLRHPYNCQLFLSMTEFARLGSESKKTCSTAICICSKTNDLWPNKRLQEPCCNVQSHPLSKLPTLVLLNLNLDFDI